MFDIQLDCPLSCYVVNESRSKSLDFLNHLEIDCNFVSSKVNDFSTILEQLDILNPAIVIIYFDEFVKTWTNTDWSKLNEFCEARFISILSICKDVECNLKNTILPDAMFTEPLDKFELQSYLQKFIQRRERILNKVLIDPITGVNSYLFLTLEVERQLHDLKRNYEPISIVYLKLDDHKIYDIKLKHLIQREMIQFIQRSIRPTDFLGHHQAGGLTLILPKTVKEDGLKLMERLLNTFSEMPFDITNGKYYPTFSYRVIEIADPSFTAEECLTLIAKQETKDLSKKGWAFESNETRIRRIKVAVIDDDRLIREMLKHQLADLGGNLYDVEIKVFKDGEEFFSDPWHRQNERFILIIDRVLPKMGGLEILRKIRKNYDRKRYLCFILGNKGPETDIAMAIQSGANDYMVKPFSIKELKIRINRLIGMISP